LQKPNAAIVKIEFEELIIEEAPIDISGFSAPEIDQILLGDDAPALEQEAAISRMWAASERLTLRAGTTSSAGARSSIDNRGTRSLRRRSGEADALARAVNRSRRRLLLAFRSERSVGD
jgi:hypothetical protein